MENFLDDSFPLPQQEELIKELVNTLYVENKDDFQRIFPKEHTYTLRIVITRRAMNDAAFKQLISTLKTKFPKKIQAELVYRSDKRPKVNYINIVTREAPCEPPVSTIEMLVVVELYDTEYGTQEDPFSFRGWVRYNFHTWFRKFLSNERFTLQGADRFTQDNGFFEVMGKSVMDTSLE